MAKNLLVGLNGQLLFEDPGDLAYGEQEEVTTACSQVTCSTPSVGVETQPPSVQIRVFKSDYTGSSIQWAGLTWTQQEVRDGVTKCACPDRYWKQLYGTAPYAYRFHVWQAWMYGNFRLERKIATADTAGTNVISADIFYGTTFDITSAKYWPAGTGSPFTVLYNANTPPDVRGEPRPSTGTAVGWYINNAWFGSATSPAGVLFSWSQGQDW